MSDYGLSEYKDIMTKILKLMKEHLPAVQDITDPYDPKWLKIVSGFEQLANEAPRSVRAYATDMMLVHVKALEDMWRYK